MPVITVLPLHPFTSRWILIMPSYFCLFEILIFLHGYGGRSCFYTFLLSNKKNAYFHDRPHMSIKIGWRQWETCVYLSGNAHQKLRKRSAAENEQQRGLRTTTNIWWNFKLQEKIYGVIFTFKNIQCQEKCIIAHLNGKTPYFFSRLISSSTMILQ